MVRVAGDAFGLIGEPDAPFARRDPAASSEPPVYRGLRLITVSGDPIGQNVAIGLTGLPDVPAKRTGATAR